VQNHFLGMSLFQFKSDEFQALLDRFDIRHVMTALYSPSSNGIVERMNGEILKLLRISCDGDYSKTWEMLPGVVEKLNSNRITEVLKVGDLVARYKKRAGKLDQTWRGNFMIEEVIQGGKSFRLRDLNNPTVTVVMKAKHVKPYHRFVEPDLLIEEVEIREVLDLIQLETQYDGDLGDSLVFPSLQDLDTCREWPFGNGVFVIPEWKEKIWYQQLMTSLVRWYDIGRPKLLDAEEKFVGRPNYSMSIVVIENLVPFGAGGRRVRVQDLDEDLDVARRRSKRYQDATRDGEIPGRNKRLRAGLGILRAGVEFRKSESFGLIAPRAGINQTGEEEIKGTACGTV